MVKREGEKGWRNGKVRRDGEKGWLTRRRYVKSGRVFSEGVITRL